MHLSIDNIQMFNILITNQGARSVDKSYCQLALSLIQIHLYITLINKLFSIYRTIYNILLKLLNCFQF